MVDFKGPLNKPAGVPTPRRFAGPVQKPVAPEAGTPGMGEKSLTALLDFMRNANDTLSFGLYDKAMEATGIDKQASEKTEESMGRNPGFAIAGKVAGGAPAGYKLSADLARNFPALAKNAWKSMFANGAISSGLFSAIDDAFRDGRIDPVGVGIDAGSGGVLGSLVHGAGRVISPKVRVAAAGSPFDDKQLADIASYLQVAKTNGIDLTVEEAAKALYPGDAVKLTALFNSSVKSPGGSQAAAGFEAQRKPGLEAASKEVVDTLGPKVSPLDVQVAANDAIGSVKDGFRATSSPLHAKVAPKKVAPSHVKKLMTKRPAIEQAASRFAKDDVLMKDVSDELGFEPTVNQMAFLNGTRDELAQDVNKAVETGHGRRTKVLLDSMDDLTGLMDRFAPDGAAARAIDEQGSAAVRDLEAGPLGVLAKSPKTSTQGNALFEVPDEVSAELAKDAVGHLPRETARGVLANRADKLNNKGKITDLFPNEHSNAVASKVVDPENMQKIDDILSKLKAVGKPGGVPHLNDASMGFLSPLVSRLLNYGKGDVVKLLQDPEMLKLLGKVGPLQQVIAQLASSTGRVVSSQQRASN